MKALILAAGLGTRLLPYTRHTPKPLFTLNGRPVLDLTVERLQLAGCQEAMINTHYHPEQIDRFLADRSYAIPVATRHEPEILGTGGAIRNVADFWSGEDLLLVVNSDIVTDIDLARVVAFHGTHRAAVTMVMHDFPRFNSVWVDPGAWVTGFDASKQPGPDHRLLAFTGIHVVTRRVLDFLPPRGPAHIIDAYTAMLRAGQGIKALIVRDHYWQDIGTPESYRSTAMDHMAPLAFEAAYGQRPRTKVATHLLQGDGSDRRWHRLEAEGHSLILADHGICARPDGRQEADAFVHIGRHLEAKGAAVPHIYLYDTFAGLVFLEDLGHRHLQDAARDLAPDARQRLYRQVIDAWAPMAVEGGKQFDTAWTWQSTHYDRGVILERECRYFVEAFLNGFLGQKACYDDLAAEFEQVAEGALRYGQTGFMHRDLQSRNIMLQGDRVRFIDFQGGRLGPLQYDLASLLIDPYVALAPTEQERLLAYAVQVLAARAALDVQGFLRGYDFCALTRNLQMLGAFGFLSRVKGKRGFEAYMPQAVITLKRRLSEAGIALPRLAAVAAEAARQLSV
jgi:aminoglycoside/choline kinase family phosphotransferase/GTP:adenosylcobinamide-phosphate guanylyltransferase